jgi:hypothetical protein
MKPRHRARGRRRKGYDLPTRAGCYQGHPFEDCPRCNPGRHRAPFLILVGDTRDEGLGQWVEA